MCIRFYYEDECPFYPDCASCYDPDSLDYLYRKDEEDLDEKKCKNGVKDNGKEEEKS